MGRGTDFSKFANLDASKRGPNGRCLCRVCGEEVPKGRETFCSSDCVEIYKIQSDPSYARRKVFERDHGVCALCGLDTEIKITEKTAAYIDRGHGTHAARKAAIRDILIVWGYPNLKRLMLWDMDHITPVVVGGSNDLANLRTLCIPCHKLVTRNLMKSLKKSPVMRRKKRTTMRRRPHRRQG